MCENYFGAFSLATIRRAFHYVSIHKKNIEPQYRVAQYREEKTEVLQTGAYISATKKKLKYIHTMVSIMIIKKKQNKKLHIVSFSVSILSLTTMIYILYPSLFII